MLAGLRHFLAETLSRWGGATQKEWVFAKRWRKERDTVLWGG
jgi:hypothetical protein